jgi:integral membrane protein
MKKSLSLFRKVAFWEGLSAVLLFFAAMPMKYLADMNWAVSVMGNIHGFLVILFLVFMIIVGQKYKWSTGVYVVCVVASIIPFGTFVLDAKFLKPLSLK